MAKRPRIAVVGSANVDLTTFTDDFPRPGETIFGRSFDLGFGGKGANQAVAARLCGADVFMVARVGRRPVRSRHHPELQEARDPRRARAQGVTGCRVASRRSSSRSRARTASSSSREPTTASGRPTSMPRPPS